MARYIDADKFAERIKLSPAFKNMAFEGDLLQRVVLDLIGNALTADVVEVDTLKDWLLEIALNNVGGDFSIACQDIISRLDGLRNFAKERKQ